MLRTCVLFLALAALAMPARAAGPNVVLFVADDHGAEALGAYGNPVVATPRLDQLASEGVATNEPHRPFNHDAEDRVDPGKVIVPCR